MSQSARASPGRVERRIAVRLPLRVRGCDARGFSSKKIPPARICAAAERVPHAVRRRDRLKPGDPIPAQAGVPRREAQDFETQGKVVHISDG